MPLRPQDAQECRARGGAPGWGLRLRAQYFAPQFDLRVFLCITCALQVLVFAFRLHVLYLYTYPSEAVKVVSEREVDCLILVQVTHNTFLHHALYFLHVRQDTTQHQRQQWTS